MRPSDRARLVSRAFVVLVLASAAGCDGTIVVDSLLDENTSSAANGTCTLREALIAANTNAAVDGCIAGKPGADLISVPAGIIALTIAGSGVDAGDLGPTEEVTIDGAGSDATIVDASGIGDRVLEVPAGVTVSLADLAIEGGHPSAPRGQPAQGGGIFNAGTLTLTRVLVTGNQPLPGSSSFFSVTGSVAEGGGIYSSGSLTLVTSQVVDNVAEGGRGDEDCFSLSCFQAPGSEGRGGGVFTTGALTLTDATIAGNVARGGFGASIGPNSIPGLSAHNAGGNGVGGGIRATASATVSVTRSTLSGNVAVGGHGGDSNPPYTYIQAREGGNGVGGASMSDAASTFTNATITGNSAVLGTGGSPNGANGTANGGALMANAGLALAHATVSANPGGTEVVLAGGSATIANSIVAASCGGLAGASLGGNVESPGDTCGLTEPDDHVSVSAAALELAGLADNGGPTETQAISPLSVAAGAGGAASCLATDQRGVARPAAGCDCGAFEVSE